MCSQAWLVLSRTPCAVSHSVPQHPLNTHRNTIFFRTTRFPPPLESPLPPGPIPKTLGNLIALRELHLSGNFLTGEKRRPPSATRYACVAIPDRQPCFYFSFFIFSGGRRPQEEAFSWELHVREKIYSMLDYLNLLLFSRCYVPSGECCRSIDALYAKGFCRLAEVLPRVYYFLVGADESKIRRWQERVLARESKFVFSGPRRYPDGGAAART